MICQHLAPLEAQLLAAGVKVTFRGPAWSDNCREWVYFDIVLDPAALQTRLQFPPFVTVHENLDSRSGTERGFFCTQCKDAVMGLLSGAKTYG